MEPLIIQALVAGGVSLTVVFAGYLANRKLGISSGQRTLVETLQSTVTAQNNEITRMRVEFDGCKARLNDVEAVVAHLRQENFDLRTDLTKRLLEATKPRPRTRRTRTDD